MVCVCKIGNSEFVTEFEGAACKPMGWPPGPLSLLDIQSRVPRCCDLPATAVRSDRSLCHLPTRLYIEPLLKHCGWS